MWQARRLASGGDGLALGMRSEAAVHCSAFHFAHAVNLRAVSQTVGAARATPCLHPRVAKACTVKLSRKRLRTSVVAGSNRGRQPSFANLRVFCPLRFAHPCPPPNSSSNSALHGWEYGRLHRKHPLPVLQLQVPALRLALPVLRPLLLLRLQLFDRNGRLVHVP